MVSSAIINALGPRPRKPVRPRRPKKSFTKSDVVWTSEEEDIVLADVLHLIPSDTRADKVRISVEKNPTNGYPIVSISYDYESINTQFTEQLHEYEERLAAYNVEFAEWEIKDAEWNDLKLKIEDELLDLKKSIKNVFSNHFKDAI